MQIFNFTEARANLKKIMDMAWDNCEPIFITRKSGKDMVLISKEEYERMDETSYLISTKANREMLDEAIKESRSEAYSYDSLEELMNEVNSEETS